MLCTCYALQVPELAAGPFKSINSMISRAVDNPSSLYRNSRISLKSHLRGKAATLGPFYQASLASLWRGSWRSSHDVSRAWFCFAHAWQTVISVDLLSCAVAWQQRWEHRQNIIMISVLFPSRALCSVGWGFVSEQNLNSMRWMSLSLWGICLGSEFWWIRSGTLVTSTPSGRLWWRGKGLSIGNSHSGTVRVILLGVVC